MGIFDFFKGKKEKKEKKTYHDNGNLREIYQINEKGKKDGFYRKYYDNGQLRVSVSFKNGNQNPGKIISFHENGKIFREVFLSKNGKFNGEFNEWYENGNIQFKGYYKNDKRVVTQSYQIDEKENIKNKIKKPHTLDMDLINDNTTKKISKNRTKIGVENFGLKELDTKLKSISKMWYQILKSRASFRPINLEKLKLSYWDMALGHTEEYMLKYENGQMDVEGIRYRIDMLNLFIDEYEKFFKGRLEKGNSVSNHIINDFLAVVESLIGAEFTLIKMVDAGELYDINELYKRKERPNSGIIKDNDNDPNTEFEDILEYSYYNGYLFNGICMYVDKNNILYETPFRFGLKHGLERTYDENKNLIQEVSYFNDKAMTINKYDSEENKLKDEKKIPTKQNKTSKNSIDNRFLKNINKVEVFSSFTDIQVRNTQISVFTSAVWQLINADGKITDEESIQFMEFAKEMSSKYLGDDDDMNDPMIGELMKDPDKMVEVIKTFPEDELEVFWDTLFSFALADGDFSVDEANLIGIIASGVYENLSDDEVRNWITKKLKS